MKTILNTCLILILSTAAVFSQEIEKKVVLDESKKVGSATVSTIQSTVASGSTKNVSSDLKWRPILTNKCVAHKPKVPNIEIIEQLKNKKQKIAIDPTKNMESENSLNAIVPVVGTNYLGNENNGSSPMDNNVAISNGGWIVSVANNTIEYDNTSGSTIYYNDIVSFIGDASITNVCDPVVLYDVTSDRFIFFAQECAGNSANSYLLICFSKTNNPNDGWWYYKLSGNLLNDGSWFDYPKIAVTTNELLISGNLFYNSGTFNQAIVYQIRKANGYAGSSLTWQYWTGISGSPFTLLPVSYGQGSSYGPGCFLVATDNAGSSNIKLYDLTNEIGANPSLNQYNVPTTAYSATGYNAGQLGTTTELKFFDCRAMSGFYLNGIIHFVFHSDAGGAWYGINYNRLTVSNLTNQSRMYGNSGVTDLGYPSVVSYATNATTKSVMIGYGRSGTSIYPEVRVVNCDNAMNFSSSTLVKSSASFVSYTGTPERWGDYTGTARKHNSATPSIWMNGMWGTNTNVWSTWVAEIHDNGVVGLTEKENMSEVKVFPNPVIETFLVEFILENQEQIDISIIDINGKVVKHLYEGSVHSGKNAFSFNKANLAAGTYFLIIKDQSKIIKNEKIIIGN